MSTPADDPAGHPEGTVGHYRAQLTAMRDRLAHSIEEKAEEARTAVDGPGQDGILHTHNADMDTEGVDAAVAVAAGLRDELKQVQMAISDLDGRPDDDSPGEDERARLDTLLSTQSFAEKLEALKEKATGEGPS